MVNRSSSGSGKQSGPLRAPIPIADLHCDLLSYLASVDNADPASTEDIGCAIPFLRSGHVKLQVLAIYSGGGVNSARLTSCQCAWFRRLLKHYKHAFHRVDLPRTAPGSMWSSGTGIVAAIENASALCGDDEPVAEAFRRLRTIRNKLGSVFYISLTHHGENRFGGGNYTDTGLKDDGRILLDHINGEKIAIDLSHASDALAHGILDHIDNNKLDIPVIASHSNFRSVYDHKRNLPDEIARAIISRGGLIGMNFLRAFLHPDDPSSLIRHILYGIKIGGQDALSFGADFFHTRGHPDQSRVPFFFREHEHAGNYQSILRSLESELQTDRIEALASGNVVTFLQRLWTKKNGRGQGSRRHEAEPPCPRRGHQASGKSA
ncbi:MAG: membrane dipeptidase [Candidatus Zixiibacteriota bacterium]|nr:MAG: membrane dipeptidase [candidate division Zixibacteria bacterium]